MWGPCEVQCAAVQQREAVFDKQHSARLPGKPGTLWTQMRLDVHVTRKTMRSLEWAHEQMSTGVALIPPVLWLVFCRLYFFFLSVCRFCFRKREQVETLDNWTQKYNQKLLYVASRLRYQISNKGCIIKDKDLWWKMVRSLAPLLRNKTFPHL